MNSNIANAFTLVVGNDLGEASGFAFDQAALVMRRIADSDLHVVHVVEGDVSAERVQQIASQLRLYLEEKVTALGGLERQAVGIHVRCGQPARELAQLAKDVGADLLVVGARRGQHLKQLIVGSVAERLLLAAPCPVFVAGPMPASQDNAHEPAIEPTCIECVQARRQSAGRAWWCARHTEHHARAHSYSFQRELPMRSHDSLVSSTGVDMR
jgi:nucleotide-binding universal stress UspA family protein